MSDDLEQPFKQEILKMGMAMIGYDIEDQVGFPLTISRERRSQI